MYHMHTIPAHTKDKGGREAAVFAAGSLQSGGTPNQLPLATPTNHGS